jgi:hypothetical protein
MISDAVDAGAGRVETLELGHRYGHLWPLARNSGRKARLCITALPVMLTGAVEAHPGFGRSASTEVKRFATCLPLKSI